ncbi:unnamed protein product [Auanema sp. JU1783]|nr:unnamed protein product [Auanema sp. JU1783]
MNTTRSYSYYYYLLFILSTTYALTCPKGWIHDSNARSCYHITRRRLTHTQASQYCQRFDNSSHLLRIECDSENDFITNILKSNKNQASLSTSTAWIDARARFDIVDSSAGLFAPGFVLRWPNGKMVRFTNWLTGNGLDLVDRQHKCVQLTPSGKWVNSGCHVPALAICEKKLHRTFDNHCPKHWVYFNQTSSCYRTVTRTNLTILEADNRCFQMGYEHNQDAMLASIANAQENSFILKIVKERKANFDFVLLGGFGRSNDGSKWHWMDGTLFDYQNWDRGMPYGKRALAVLVMNKRGKWINHYADKILSQYNSIAVCKYKTGTTK